MLDREKKWNVNTDKACAVAAACPGKVSTLGLFHMISHSLNGTKAGATRLLLGLFD